MGAENRRNSSLRKYAGYLRKILIFLKPGYTLFIPGKCADYNAPDTLICIKEISIFISREIAIQ